MAILQIPITKAKGQFVEFDTDALPQDVFTEAVLQGLKVLANRGTSKITSASYPDATERATAAVAKANEQHELIMTSKIKFTGQKKASGVSGKVKTEAMRLARNLVKDEMKRLGIKVSHVKASEITSAAKDLLETQPELVDIAKAEIEKRESINISGSINIADAIKTDPTLVAKAESRKSKAAGTLSAKQAGKVKTRAKGAQATA